MKSIADMLPEMEQRVRDAPKGRHRLTERGEIMRFFLQHVNAGRKRDGFPPMSMARMGVILEKIPTEDLYYLKSVCIHANDFSKRFWWELKPKTKKKKLMNNL